MRRIAIMGVVLVCALAVLAGDVTFLNNRRQWEKLPTATLMQMGNDFINHKNMPDSALLCYSLIANRYNESLKGEELKQCIRAICYVGRIYDENYHNHQQAYRHLLESKELAEKHHYREFMPDALMYLGNLYWSQNALTTDTHYQDEALECHRTAFSKAIESENYELVPIIFLNMTYVAFSTEQLPKITDEIDTYSRLTLSDSIPTDVLGKTVCRAIIHITHGRSQQAMDIFKNASTDVAGILNKTETRIMFNEYVYGLQMKLGRYTEALETLMRLEWLVRNEAPELKHTTNLQLSEYYRKLGKQTLADKYELLWWRCTDSIAHVRHADEFNTVRFLHEIDKMNEEQQALVVKQQHDRQLLWIVGAAALVAFVLLVLLYINRRRIQENYRQLYEKNQALLAAEDARRQEADVEQVTEVVPEAPKYSHNQMDDDVMDELWLQIKRVMETCKEIYDEQFTIDQLAELIGVKKNYVSQTINTKTGQAFSVLLNEYRIREACRRMNDCENYGNYSVEGIAQSVGYGSRSHFAKLFKAATGVPPSTYMKMCKEGTSPAPTSRREVE